MLTREDYLKGVIKIEFNEFKKFIEKANQLINQLIKDIEERDIFDKPLVYIQFCNNLLKIKIYDKEGLTEIGSIPVLENETSISGEYRDINPTDISDIYNFIESFGDSTLDGVVYLFFSVRKMIVNIDRECLVIY
jgi:hypothetical protein